MEFGSDLGGIWDRFELDLRWNSFCYAHTAGLFQTWRLRLMDLRKGFGASLAQARNPQTIFLCLLVVTLLFNM